MCKEKKLNKETKEKNQTQLKTFGRNVGGEKKIHQQSSKKNMETQRSKSALKICPRSKVGGEWQKEHDHP